MLNEPFSPWPSYTPEEADAVQRVLLSNKVNYWTGDECRAFEREFAAFAGTEYAVAVANGTVALDMALRAMGIGAGDEVVVTSRTFLASASAIVNVGATPVFADVDRDSQNITAESVTAVLSPATQGGAVRASGRLALRHGRHDGARRAARPLSDRGLRPGPRRHLAWPSGGRFRPCGLLVVLPRQDHDHRWGRGHGHY